MVETIDHLPSSPGFSTFALAAITAPDASLRQGLFSGPTAPIWDYVIHHVRNQRNVKKIRGNLRLYGHLQELELRLQQRLRFLSAATRGRQAALKPLQEQVGPAGSVGPGHAPWLRPLLPLAAAPESRCPRPAGHAHPRGGPAHLWMRQWVMRAELSLKAFPQ
ncbi:uncharacterized protein VK521_009562 [Ammospiza maritima maritima]